MPESVDVLVFVARGKVARTDILRAGLLEVRDQLPAVFDCKPDIAGTPTKASRDGVDGYEYTVRISYTPRGTAGETDEVDVVGNVVASLEVPSIDTVLTSPEDAA